MASIDFGTTDVPTAGTRVQISSSLSQVKAIEFHARSGNTGAMYVGDSTVSSTSGRELRPGEVLALSFGDASIPFNVFYLDTATNGNDCDWVVLFV